MQTPSENKLILAVDDYGNVRQSVTVGYGRRQADPDLPSEDRQWQARTLMTCMENVYTNPIEEDERGRFVVHASMPEDGWVYGMILSYGDNVEVLSPERIRSVVGEIAESIHSIYKKS